MTGFKLSICSSNRVCYHVDLARFKPGVWAMFRDRDDVLLALQVLQLPGTCRWPFSKYPVLPSKGPPPSPPMSEFTELGVLCSVNLHFRDLPVSPMLGRRWGPGPRNSKLVM